MTLKFDEQELDLVEKASRADHDRRANWCRRMILLAAETRLNFAAGGSDPPTRT